LSPGQNLEMDKYG